MALRAFLELGELPMTRPSVSSSLVIALLASACSAVEPDRGSVVRRDSAGVEIVEAKTPLWEDRTASRWRLDPSPITDLSDTGLGEMHEFFRVRGMRRLSSGAIAVGNGV